MLPTNSGVDTGYSGLLPLLKILRTRRRKHDVAVHETPCSTAHVLCVGALALDPCMSLMWAGQPEALEARMSKESEGRTVLKLDFGALGEVPAKALKDTSSQAEYCVAGSTINMARIFIFDDGWKEATCSQKRNAAFNFRSSSSIGWWL